MRTECSHVGFCVLWEYVSIYVLLCGLKLEPNWLKWYTASVRYLNFCTSWSFFEAPSKLLGLFLWFLEAWEQKVNCKVLLAVIVSLAQGAGLLNFHWTVALSWTWLLCCLLSSCYSTFPLSWPHMSPPPCDRSLCPTKEVGHSCQSESLLAPQPASTLFWPWQQNGSSYCGGSQMLCCVLWGTVLWGLQMPQTYSWKGLAPTFLSHCELSQAPRSEEIKVNCFWQGAF